MSIRSVFCAVCLAACSLAAREELFNIDFGRSEKPCNVSAMGSFHGVLPIACVENFAGWKPLAVTSEVLTENGRSFLRFHTGTKGSPGQFCVYVPSVDFSGLMELTVLARVSSLPMSLGLRQIAAPYCGYWEGDFPASGEWKEMHFTIRSPMDAKNGTALFFYPGAGDADIAFMKLVRMSRENFLKTIHRPDASVKNFFRDSRFPLGMPTGWNVDRESCFGSCQADPSRPGADHLPSLKMSSDAGISVYSEPFQTTLPDRTNTVSVVFQCVGAWHVALLREGHEMARRDLPPSATWRTERFPFIPPGEATSFCLKFTGTGTLWLDSLAAFAGTENPPADRACEVALAPGASEISETRIHFADEPAEVLYRVVGNSEGATLKARVTDLYGRTAALPDRTLEGGGKAGSGAVRYDVFPDAPLGQFRVQMWAERGGTRVSPIAETVVTRVDRPVCWNRDAPDSPFGCHFIAQPKTIRTMKACGINWARLHDAGLEYIGWWNLEAEKGTWTFHDEELKHYRESKIKIFAQLGTSPAWASHYSELGCKSMGYFEKFLKPKNNEDFYRYVKTVAARYKGVIDEYFIWNEPWGPWWKSAPDVRFYGADQTEKCFAELSRGTYQALKSVDPGARFTGFNTTAGTVGQQWTKAVCDAGAFDNCDAIDFHLYARNATCQSSDGTGEAYREAVGYILEKHPDAGGKPIYMSEGQGSSSGSDGGNSHLTGLYQQTIPWLSSEDFVGIADTTCRYTVSLLAQRVAKVFLYTAHGYTCLSAHPAFMVLLGPDGFPHPAFAAYSHMTRLLEGKKFIRVIPLNKDRFAYLFSDGRVSCAVLAGLSKADLAALPFRGKGMKTTDLFGNPFSASRFLPGTLLYVEGPVPADLLSRAIAL